MLLNTLKLNRLLSFGPDAETIALRPLNVLIGPNGSGKSNFIAAIGLLQAAPKDLMVPIRSGGGGSAWIWQGEPTGTAELEAVVTLQHQGLARVEQLRHRLVLGASGQFSHLEDERIEDIPTVPGEPTMTFFRYDKGMPALGSDAEEQATWRERLDIRRSVLSQVKDASRHLHLLLLGEAYERIRLYRHWSFGHDAAPRRPQPSDLPTDYLMEDSRNLGLILNKFRRDVPTKRALIEELKSIFEGVTDFSVQVEGGTVQIFLEEERWTIPATRLSDGTLRWLALLAVLLDPRPPPLVCIEEPELRLHPDLMNPLARLLKSASERMQIILTTHSEALVDAFTDTPEDVLVCERRNGSTAMQRLDREGLSAWLEEYSLGHLWSKGELGGTRW